MLSVGPVLNLVTEITCLNHDPVVSHTYRSLLHLESLKDRSEEVELKLCWLPNPICPAQCLTWQCGNMSGVMGDIGGAALLYSSLRIVMGRSHQGTPWVCVLRENWQEQKREEGDSNEWAIVREIEEHLYGLLCHWSCKMETYFSPDSYSRSNPLSWAAYDVVHCRGGPRGCPKGLLFLVRD